MTGAIESAVALLRRGELVAFPTETVYGLGADAANAAAVAKIFAAKGRPADHPLIVHLPDAGHLRHWARDIPDAAWALAQAFWPGPLTLILKRQPTVLSAVTGGQDTVGLRVPNHSLALELLRQFNGGIAAPSANRFGHVSPTTAQHVRDDLGPRVAAVLDGGPCDVGIESTIVDLTSAQLRILRPGAIGPAQLAGALGQNSQLEGVTGVVKGGANANLDNQSSSTGSGNASAASPEVPRVSGSLAAHYAPRTPLVMMSAAELVEAANLAMSRRQRIGVIAMFPPVGTSNEPPAASVCWRQLPATPAGFAQALYATLREMDGQGCERLIVQQPPAEAAWAAVLDRLSRAVVGSGIRR